MVFIMREIKRDKACKGHALMMVLGLMALVLNISVIITDAAPYAYITNSGNNTVSVIDTATNNVTATVTVGSGPEGVAVTRMEQRYMWRTMTATLSL